MLVKVHFAVVVSLFPYANQQVYSAAVIRIGFHFRHAFWTWADLFWELPVLDSHRADTTFDLSWTCSIRPQP